MYKLFESLKLYWPFFVVIILTVYLFFSNETHVPFSMDIGIKFFSVPLPVTDLVLLRIILALLICALIIFGLNRNYAKFFPRFLSFNIYFDEEGIQRYLDEIARKSKKDFGIDSDWVNKRKDFFSYLDEGMSKEVGNEELKSFFTSKNMGLNLSCSGKAEYEYVSRDGWQKYKIKSLDGSINFKLKREKKEDLRLKSNFRLDDSDLNYYSPKIEEFLKGRMFMKSYLLHSILLNKVNMHEERIAGLTKVRFVPFTELLYTVSCFVTEEGLLVPYSYTKYLRINHSR